MSDDPVTLRVVDPDNEAAVRALRVAPDQELFVSSVPKSIEEARRSPDVHPWFRATYAGERPVGFVMLSYDLPPGNPEAPWRYFLWRLLIDAEYQRRGYGRAAMALVIDLVRNSPGATGLFTSVHAGDGGPAPSIDPRGSNRPGSGSTAKRSTDSRSIQVHSRTHAHHGEVSPHSVLRCDPGPRCRPASA